MTWDVFDMHSPLRGRLSTASYPGAPGPYFQPRGFGFDMAGGKTIDGELAADEPMLLRYDGKTEDECQPPPPQEQRNP